jgi:sugar phosphate isomerase/epimerase
MRRNAATPPARFPTRRQYLRFTAGTLGALALLPEPGIAGSEQPAGSRSRTTAGFHLGLASYTCRKFDLDRTLAMARRVGLDHICLKSFHLPLDAKPAEIAAVAEKVKAAGLVLYGGGVITMKTEREVTQAFDYAKAAGMALVTAAPTPEILPLVDQKVKMYDIQVAVHNHGPGDRYFPTPQSVYERVENLDRRIGLCIDIGHTVRIGADLVGSVRKFGDRVYDLHVKDVTAATPQGGGVPLGRGIIDIPGLVRALIEIKFKGVAAFEYEEQPDDPLPGLAESVGYMRGVMATTS